MLFDEEAGIFRPIYRNRTTAGMQEPEQRTSSCRVGQSILGQPPGRPAVLRATNCETETFLIVQELSPARPGPKRQGMSESPDRHRL